MKVQEQRFMKAQGLLAARQLDAVVVTSPPNFFYFSGIWLDSNERLQAVVIPKTGTPKIIVHEMFREEVSGVKEFEQLFWSDGIPPIELLAKVLPAAGTVSVDNQWPSGNLISLMEVNKQLSYVHSTPILGALRLIKDDAEIKLLEESANYADQIMDRVIEFVKPGVTELEVAEEIKKLFRKEGINQLSFEPIVATGSNAAMPHHVPDDTVLREGDTVVIDMGGIKDYYCSDITRTIVLGEATPEIEKVYQVVQRAQEAAVKAIKPGLAMQDIDQVARGIITEAGYGEYFTHRTGHGLGIEVHEEPYLSPGNRQILKEGMVVSVEPGIYLPGKFGVRIEDIVVVTADGAERMNHYPRHLICRETTDARK
ncbi:peptidase M24 [Desulfotomaculum nigrificans CO-1-SRB]|uniref:Peptidase M24 n=1 Tax=Desulfotomaculum nigrificans (strain DSM 14880 / VKM B-2319 / CO-1-SRB) TaxID=868595 RepID=F6B7R9_DESCC|nr:Xaa-Pro peptidase family protein [Desulfotomaculum nigrificans]AEF93441.1 peptidase M24 [Desulfotomaculum nigrificans CO-1-SRB]